MNKEALIARIHSAFADAQYPGDDCLRGSDEGVEPFLLEKEFRGKLDWRTLDSPFLDQAPDGCSSSLFFFSDEALKFYLPAYLIADINGELLYCDPVFCLCHGLEAGSADIAINPGRYGDLTWSDYSSARFADFNADQSAAIADYLELKRSEALTDLERRQLDEALSSFWRPRAAR